MARIGLFLAIVYILFAHGAAAEEQFHDDIFRRDGNSWVLSDQWVPYAVDHPLFTDYAQKLRAVHVPEGKNIEWNKNNEPIYPEGTKFLKVFYYYRVSSNTKALVKLQGPTEWSYPIILNSRRINFIEARILVRINDTWEPYVYVWQSERGRWVRKDYGDFVELGYLGGGGKIANWNYEVPDRHQCAECHENTLNNRFEILGFQADRLQKKIIVHGIGLGQVDWLEGLGILKDHRVERELVKYDGQEEIARRYLDSNCAHCHRPSGAAAYTALDLRYKVTDPRKTGVCKRPAVSGVRAGYEFDVKPGEPMRSGIYIRLSSIQAGLKMPEIGRNLVDKNGEKIIFAWIKSMRSKEKCD